MEPSVGRTRRDRAHRWSVPIGRVAGIPLRVHVTFVLLLLLFVGPGQTVVGYLTSVVWLAGIFACVVVHELAHSLLARRRGVTVGSIVLLPIGGVSELERLPDNPRDELHIAVVGPLASFALAGLAGGAALLAGQALWPVGMSSGWLTDLFWFNLIVGAFNLVPAFPLDGGRVLRALLQRRYDLEGATRRAAMIGRVLGGVLVLLGFFDLWLAFVGLFVFVAASAEEAGTVAHARLKGLRVRDAMIEDPVTVDPTLSGAWAAHIARRAAQRSLPVVADGRYVGMVDAEAAERERTTSVADLADLARPTLDPDGDLEDALRMLASWRVAGLTVTTGERIVGLLDAQGAARLVRERAARPAAV